MECDFKATKEQIIEDNLHMEKQQKYLELKSYGEGFSNEPIPPGPPAKPQISIYHRDGAEICHLDMPDGKIIDLTGMTTTGQWAFLNSATEAWRIKNK